MRARWRCVNGCELDKCSSPARAPQSQTHTHMRTSIKEHGVVSYLYHKLNSPLTFPRSRNFYYRRSNDILCMYRIYWILVSSSAATTAKTHISPFCHNLTVKQSYDADVEALQVRPKVRDLHRDEQERGSITRIETIDNFTFIMTQN